MAALMPPRVPHWQVGRPLSRKRVPELAAGRRDVCRLRVEHLCAARLGMGSRGHAVIRPTMSCPACPMHTDHLDWSLAAYRRGTLRGMDAA
ncbi:hypothetical protein XarCFBP6771_19015 [Xanthomonas arboricola]|nr:hypothetical protein XarCFBP6771_19015 [Xanthomonas arboricola]